MDLASYKKVLDGARKHYGSRKPEFVYRTKPTNVGEWKSIVLPGLDGTYPIDPANREFAFLTARAWGERCFFWTQDVGTRRCIVDGRGRCPVKLNANRPKLLVTYHEWLGVQHLGVRGGFGREVLAFKPPSPDIPATLPSPQPTVPEPGYESDTSDSCSSKDEYLADSPCSPSDSKRPGQLRPTRSPTALLRASAPCESRRMELRATSANTTDTSADNCDAGADPERLVECQHLIRSHNAGPCQKIAQIREESTAFGKLVDEDRQYYGDRRPPFVMQKNLYRKSEMCVLLFDKQGQVTNEQIHMHLQSWNRHECFWRADVHGERMILQHDQRGLPWFFGHTYRQWLGYRRGSGEVVAVSGQLHKGSGQSKPLNKRKRTAPRDERPVAAVAVVVPAKRKSKAQRSRLVALARGLKRTRGRRQLTCQRQEIPESDVEDVLPPRTRRTGSTISISSSKSSSPGTVVDESDEILSNNIRVPLRRRSISTPFQRRNRSSEIPAASRRGRRQAEPNTDSDVADDMTLRTASATSSRPRSPSRRPTDSGYHGSERLEIYESAAAAGIGFAPLTSREAILKQRLRAFDKLHRARPLRVHELEEELETSAQLLGIIGQAQDREMHDMHEIEESVAC